MRMLPLSRTNPRRDRRPRRESGIVIVLVAVVMLGVVGAMAALSIDVVTLYTARSEAQLAADSAALAGARVLANSGMTSDNTGGLAATAENQARAVATQVAASNLVGGRALNPAGALPCNAGQEICVGFIDNVVTNPRVSVSVQRTDLPTFFARIWGRTAFTVGASALAEAYNPSGANALGKPTIRVAPICVKPWLLPNIDPLNSSKSIFDAATGAISDPNLLGWKSSSPATQLSVVCTNGDCSGTPLPTPTSWKYYPGDTATGKTFAHPLHSLPTCNPVLTPYQESVAACIQTPISCKSPPASLAQIDTSDYATRDAETAVAVNCLAHTGNNKGDIVDAPFPPASPFEFIVGADNPVAVVNPGLVGKEVMTSDSLVTVPVYDSSTGSAPGSTVTIIGFVQLFLNPDGNATPASGLVNTTVVNIVGCGNNSSNAPPILGNGASPVAVRLVSP